MDNWWKSSELSLCLPVVIMIYITKSQVTDRGDTVCCAVKAAYAHTFRDFFILIRSVQIVRNIIVSRIIQFMGFSQLKIRQSIERIHRYVDTTVENTKWKYEYTLTFPTNGQFYYIQFQFCISKTIQWNKTKFSI